MNEDIEITGTDLSAVRQLLALPIHTLIVGRDDKGRVRLAGWSPAGWSAAEEGSDA